jgi:hypothetical protein
MVYKDKKFDDECPHHFEIFLFSLRTDFNQGLTFDEGGIKISFGFQWITPSEAREIIDKNDIISISLDGSYRCLSP